MKDAAAISAQLVDIRNVGVHKSLKLTIHVPEEQALKAIEVFGWPTGANPVPVALARLVNPAQEDAHKPPPAQNPKLKAGATRKSTKLSQRAGILCNDPVFIKFLHEKTGRYISDPAEFVRDYCCVDSRSEIILGTAAGDFWNDLYSKFVIWRDEPDLAEAAE